MDFSKYVGITYGDYLWGLPWITYPMASMLAEYTYYISIQNVNPSTPIGVACDMFSRCCPKPDVGPQILGVSKIQ